MYFDREKNCYVTFDVANILTGPPTIITKHSCYGRDKVGEELHSFTMNLCLLKSWCGGSDGVVA